MPGEIRAQYGFVKIVAGTPLNEYRVQFPRFSADEQDLADKLAKIMGAGAGAGTLKGHPLVKGNDFFSVLQENIVQEINLGQMGERIPAPQDLARVEAALQELLGKSGVAKAAEIAHVVVSQSIGHGFLSPFMVDDALEEVMVNGFNENVFVFHREFGQCRTNVVVSEAELTAFIQRVARTEGRLFNAEHSLLDARLPDGSRVNATFSYVTPNGHTLTIRKFYRNPVSIVSLIENNTLSADVAAFLWAMVEGLNAQPKNIIVTGGTGSGKTTFMVVLARFIPASRRVISIEDTLEVDLSSHPAWVPLESRKGMKNLPEVSMDDLLKNALRMRPDRIVVGEVRGEEAQTLFVAMDTGHAGILGTLHANSARESLIRMKTPPMNVPESMLPLLDLIVVMQRTHAKGSGDVRTIKHIAEITRLDDKTLLSNIFEFDRKTGSLVRTDVPSAVMEDFALQTGMGKQEFKRELLVREKILEWMLVKGIKENDAVQKIIEEYYFDQRKLLEKVSADLHHAK